VPRPIRYDFLGARHHIMNRSRSGEPLFRDGEDFALFYSLLGECVRRYELAITAFVLMPSHYHLRAISRAGKVSGAIGFLQSQYSRRSNHRSGTDGPRFRARFANRLVFEDDHWLYLLAYLHLNPVRAGLVSSADEYRWSSHAYFSGVRKAPAWLDRSEDWATLEARARYAELIDACGAGVRPVPSEFDDDGWRSATDLPALQLAETRVEDDVVNNVLIEVCKAAGVPPRRLLESRSGIEGNPARAAALFQLVCRAGVPLTVAAGRLGMSSPAARQVLHRLRRSERTNHAAKKIIAKLP
jgi:REP element-mobilizing transposase RayT